MLSNQNFEDIKAYLEKASWPPHSDSWYYAGVESKFNKGMHTVDLLNNKLMIFKNEQNQLVALQRNCLHMHADLSKGKFSKSEFTCPMHGWKYTSKGVCKHIQTAQQLKEYPLEVVMGHVFVYCGSESNYYPFPKFDISEERLVMSKRTINIESNVPWFMLGGNGFDLHHFYTVHFREIMSEPIINLKSKNRIQTDLVFKNIGTHIYDRILRFFYGSKLELNYEVAGANIVLAIAKISKKNNYMFFCIQPDATGRSDIYLFFLKEKSAIPLLDTISLFIRRIFIKRFFQEELDSVKELTLLPERLTEHDLFLMRYLKLTHESITKK